MSKRDEGRPKPSQQQQQQEEYPKMGRPPPLQHGDFVTYTPPGGGGGGGGNNHNELYEFWKQKVQMNGWLLRHAPPTIRGNKEIVLEAVRQNGMVLRFASPQLVNDYDVVMEAINSVNNNKDSNNLIPLQFASPTLQHNPDIVWAAIERSNGNALQYASESLRQNKSFVLRVVQSYGRALEFVEDPTLLTDRDVVLAAITSDPNAIKFVNDPTLRRDPQLMIASGMLDDHNNNNINHSRTTTISSSAGTTTSTTPTKNNKNSKKKIALSTRFSLHAKSISEATQFTSLLKNHEYIRSNQFQVYAPNAFDKQSCDQNWTDFDWPCRGTKDTCQYNNVLTADGQCRPTDDCCWRYSFRYQLEQAKKTGGFMLQVIESGGPDDPEIRLGKGQRIEQDMAQEIQLKIFQVYRPKPKNPYLGRELNFESTDIDVIVAEIQQWYDVNNCQDMTEKVIGPLVVTRGST